VRIATKSDNVLDDSHYNAKTQNRAIYDNIKVVKRINGHCTTISHTQSYSLYNFI